MQVVEKYSIKTGLRDGKTILKEVFFTPPFNVVDIRVDKSLPLLEAMVMSSSPGMLNDDYYDINIDVIDNSAFNLQTQAYQRLYISEKGTTQRVHVNVGENAYFSYVPHPTVPQKGANFTSENKIYLKKSSQLLWSEILTCGRKWMEGGESFAFEKHHSITEIYVDRKLIFKDNLYVAPKHIPPNTMGQYEGYTHQAGLVFIAPDIDVEAEIKRIYQNIQDEKEINFGMSKISENAFVLRILGNSGEQLFNIVSQIRREKNEALNKGMCLIND